MPLLLALGLSAYLNLTFVDDHVRSFSGHTQINATDLRQLRYPTVEDLVRLGGGSSRRGSWPEQQELDVLVCGVRAGTRHDPESRVNAAQQAKVFRASEARACCMRSAFRAQHRTSARLCAAPSLDLRPRRRGRRQRIDAVAHGRAHAMAPRPLQQDYAANTRETIRRQTLASIHRRGSRPLQPRRPAPPGQLGANCYQIAPAPWSCCAPRRRATSMLRGRVSVRATLASRLAMPPAAGWTRSR